MAIPTVFLDDFMIMVQVIELNLDTVWDLLEVNDLVILVTLDFLLVNLSLIEVNPKNMLDHSFVIILVVNLDNLVDLGVVIVLDSMILLFVRVDLENLIALVTLVVLVTLDVLVFTIALVEVPLGFDLFRRPIEVILFHTPSVLVDLNLAVGVGVDLDVLHLDIEFDVVLGIILVVLGIILVLDVVIVLDNLVVPLVHAQK